MTQTGTLHVHHQNLMLAVRLEMGWPDFKPANDCLAFSSGRIMDLETGTELGRIAQMLGKDVVYSSWKSAAAVAPAGFAIAYRELLTVDIIDDVFPFAANDDAAVVFVSPRRDELFAVDRRGSLVRVPGRPKTIAKGRTLAMKRIRATAAAMDRTLLEHNRLVPPGATSIEPETPAGVVVRFN